VGMLPMSLGLGEGGEQNAPLGRAVIGGLLVATFFTLIFVPVLYTVLRRKPPAGDTPEDEEESELWVRVPEPASGLEPSDDPMLVAMSESHVSGEER